jgi:hypothetical protein
MFMRALVKTVLPEPILARYRSRLNRRTPPVGRVRFGDLRRLQPIDRGFGAAHGTTVGRYYIERFLGECSQDIQGRVLEIGDDRYTRQFGGSRVRQSDVFSAAPGPGVTYVGDLTRADEVESNSYDCIVFAATLHRILKPGSVLLATLAATSHISRYDMDRWGDFWRFTSRSAGRLFSDAFPGGSVKVHAYGNVLMAVAHMYGLVAEEFTPEEINYFDPDYEVQLAVRAVKPADLQADRSSSSLQCWFAIFVPLLETQLAASLSLI